MLLGLGALAAACGTRERIVIVHEPAPANQNPEPTSAVVPVASNPGAPNDGDPSWGIRPSQEAQYAEVVDRVVRMTSDGDLQRRVRARNLSMVNVSWEDTGRNLGSSVGPNISDLTLQVNERDRNMRGSLMPVVRHPNFADRTADIRADRFFVRVGNEQALPAGAAPQLRSVALTEVLRDISRFASAPGSLASSNLLAPRDTHFLVSAQAVFLPIPKAGAAEFTPALFNYQSRPGNPAVLSILVTRQGTSVRVVENRGDEPAAGGRGQALFFNNGGQRAPFTAERRSEVATRIAAQGGPKNDDERSALQKGADVLFLIQVPLVVAPPVRRAQPPSPSWPGGAAKGGAMAPAAKPQAAAAEADDGRGSDVEQAVLGHGENRGPYREGHGGRLIRDTRFPVRVTVQFYKATSNGVVSDQDLDGIAASLGSVYEHADFVGSLVMPEGDRMRPTAWANVPSQWFPW
jgi:hypothetical protein